jgi:hypothetical protein
MTALADEAAGLICAFHEFRSPGAESPGNRGVCIRATPREVNGNPPKITRRPDIRTDPGGTLKKPGFRPFLGC